jgi:hypothetical protein
VAGQPQWGPTYFSWWGLLLASSHLQPDVVMFEVATTIWDQELKNVKASKVWSQQSDEELFSGTLRGANDFLHDRLGERLYPLGQDLARLVG